MGNKEKHKKHKKEKSKKHKKEKKSKKHKKEKSRKRSYSTTSDSSSESETEVKVKKESLEKTEWGLFDAVLNDSNTTIRDRKIKKARSRSPDKPGQSARELNPYWKDGGCGLPPAYDPSKRSETSHSGSDSFSNENKKSRYNFLKPGEASSYNLPRNTYQGNWRKKDTSNQDELKPKAKENEDEENKNQPATSTAKAYTADDLNSLAAKIMKAEIMGNTALVEKLKAEFEVAKHNKEPEADKKSKEIVIMTDRGAKKHNEGNYSHKISKKQKVNTHNEKERVCYFPDDDKYSLKNLFEKEKSGQQDDQMLYSKIRGKTSEEIDDAYLEAAASKKNYQKQEERMSQRSIKEAMDRHKAVESCTWCLDNRNKTKHLIISTGNKCYLCVPEDESLTSGHCLIVPLQHELSTMHLDEDVWDEIKNYQKALSKMFLEQDKDVVFFENARAFKHFPHSYIQCVPLDKEMGDLAPIYFQKAISESETEWSTNKKLIDFRNKDLRRSIPKGLPYFAVSFGMEGGFAHLIEDEFLFKRNFAEEVLGGMMDFDHRKWRKPQKENFASQRAKSLEFLKQWKNYEFNETNADSDSSSSD